jgi:DNA-binding LacI/PurR family transcriptional regulator
MTKAPTISDVARAAGVSVASVSRALSNSKSVTDELHARVMAAVETTGYRPQRSHRHSMKAPWLAILVTDIVEQFHLQVIGGIQEQAEAKGYLPVIIQVTGGSAQLSGILRQMRGITLAGIIAVGLDLTSEAWIEHWDAVQTPIVVLNTPVSHPKIASILVDFETAASQATQHLLDLGHSRIVYLGDYDNRLSAAEFRGIVNTLARRGIAYPDAYRISIPNTVEGVSQGVSRIMALPAEARPTAIFAFDDEVAINVLNALRYYELCVPEDISVVGFDNIPMAAHTFPPLTTLDVPKRRAGRQMVLLLEDLQKNQQHRFGTTIIEATLVVRRSTGPAPGHTGERRAGS